MKTPSNTDIKVNRYNRPLIWPIRLLLIIEFTTDSQFYNIGARFQAIDSVDRQIAERAILFVAAHCHRLRMDGVPLHHAMAELPDDPHFWVEREILKEILAAQALSEFGVSAQIGGRSVHHV